jgi:hypothetical protein
MKTFWGSSGIAPSFFTSAPGENECQLYAPAYLITEKEPQSRIDGRPGGPTAGVEAGEKSEESLALTRNRIPAAQFVVHRRKIWATPVPLIRNAITGLYQQSV